MSPHSFKLTIVGAGRGGEALLKVLQDDSNIEVIAISDARTDAPALALAQSLHIPVFHTINELPACDMAINVTGSSEASQQLRGHYAGNVEIMEGKAAHFFYDQVGKRKQENEQVERMLTEFEKLNRVGRQLNNTNNLSQMLNLVLKESLQVTNSPAGTISLYDKTTRALSLHSAYGFSEGFENQEPWIVRQGGLTEHIFNERKPFVVPDIAKSDAFTLNSVLAIEGVAALVAVPLAIANEVVGILYVNDFSPRDYDENQVNILDMLANQATHAIQKARLFQAIEEEKNELRSLNENLETRIMERTSDLTKTNEELIRSNQAKSQFLSNMSHELRTPLTSINGFSEFLLDGFVGPLNEAQTKYLTNINVSGKHLLELINGILDLSKIESGKMSLKLEKVSIPPLLDEIILVLEGYAAKANVELELQYSEGIPAIFIDRTKFKQILYNLCSNAIKFSPEASKVSVDVNYSDPSNLSDNSVQYASLAIAVRDQGIGIAAKDQEIIFNPFEQADGSHSRHFEGTGLGLTLTRRLVEMHGGHISVESTPGEGSCFSFTLPVDSKLPTATVTSDSSLSTGKIIAQLQQKPRDAVANDAPMILVVDDDAHSLEISTLYLSNAGYRVCHAMNGDDALDVARRKRPFLILLDVMMPGKDGWEVLQELKLDAETSDIPIIICTVSENEELGVALGATDYLAKPIDRDLLANKLTTLSKGITRRRHALHVLAIDDDEKIRELYDATLTAQGYKVHTAACGEEGLELAESMHPDMILLDLMMPGMDGFEVAEELKKRPQTEDIPIIVVTARDLSVSERIRLMGHIEDCVSKETFNKEKLLQEIQQFETRYPYQAGLKDSISGLLNHRYFTIRLGQELSRSKRNGQSLACVLFDLDDFARFSAKASEAYVHAALRKVGNFFMNNLRGSDIATRHRIDEFAMILTQTELEGALLVIKRLKNLIESYPFPGEEVLGEKGLTSCAAITIFPDDGSGPEELMNQCQYMIQRAKAEGGNKLCYYQDGEMIVQ